MWAGTHGASAHAYPVTWRPELTSSALLDLCLPYLLKLDLSFNPKLVPFSLASWAAENPPSFSQPRECWDYRHASHLPAFSMLAGDLNPGPYAYMASISSNEPPS